ncbi:hypothetical protein [Rurimicrobium arvi]|uniref:Uncharacterized protein n=1 Tax=Rurimicrobium arvi TaxID=2049916 RepID=A0ABP8N1B1_9BACT
MHKTSRFDIPLCLAYLYVFFDALFLPGGIYYTTFLAPLFLYHHVRTLRFGAYLWYIAIACGFFLVQRHLIVGYTDYLRSNLLTLLNLSFVVLCYGFFNTADNDRLNLLFRRIVYFNFLMVLVALLAYCIPPVKPLFWYMIPVTMGSGIVDRLKMLWYEASVYSLVFSPFFLYFFLYGVLIRRRLRFSFFLLLVLPLVLSNSLGVCLCLIASIAVTVFFYRKVFLSPQLFRQLLLLFLSGCLLLGTWYLLDHDNLLFLRLRNILSGHDTSARGRTYEAFAIAGRLCDQYHCWWTGIGPGQFKLLGKELLFHYYQYSGNVRDIRIPNACADTLIVYGLTGLILRLGLLIFLFFYRKVYENIFRFSLFVFLFIYQFSGSYFNNLIEWVMWALVFSDALTMFSRKNIQTPQPYASN